MKHILSQLSKCEAFLKVSFDVLHKLPLADSIIFAAARKYSAVIWTPDNDFEGLSNVRYVSKNNP